MTRASAGTRVNSSGLIETVELLGSEEITNGNFATNTDWAVYGNTEISNGKANLNSGTGAFANTLSQSSVVTNLKNYKISFTISNYQEGEAYVSIGFNTSFVVNADGDYTFYGVSQSGDNTNFLIRNGTTNFVASIDNISVKESTKNNLARVDYDGTASSLLVEPQRTNDITNSETFGSTGWSQVLTGTAIAPIVTDNYAISPDGTQNAQRIQYNLGGGTSSGDRTIIREFIDTQTDWFLSVFLKSATGADQKILWHSNSDSNETTITNEWKRYELDRNGITNAWFGLGLRGSVSTVNTCDVLVYGLQAEQGSYPTSYIPTSGSTVTRVQDQYTKTGISNLINSEEGVFYFETSIFNPTLTPTLSISDNSDNNTIRFRFQIDTNTFNVNVRKIGIDEGQISVTIADSRDINKYAVRYQDGDYAIFINGSLISSNNNLPTFTDSTLTTLNFNRGGGSSPFFGKVKQLQVFETALTDSELIALTSN
tara:strand:- start:730 stop:2181 length:1452 start_codon:yes stop_codon:yes gene_type:complete